MSIVHQAAETADTIHTIAYARRDKFPHTIHRPRPAISRKQLWRWFEDAIEF